MHESATQKATDKYDDAWPNLFQDYSGSIWYCDKYKKEFTFDAATPCRTFKMAGFGGGVCRERDW